MDEEYDLQPEGNESVSVLGAVCRFAFEQTRKRRKKTPKKN
jgi:hypothetical protein